MTISRALQPIPPRAGIEALVHAKAAAISLIQKTTGTKGVAPSETGMMPAGRTIFLHMGHVRSRASQVLMQVSQKKWLHVSLMGVLIASYTAIP